MAITMIKSSLLRPLRKCLSVHSIVQRQQYYSSVRKFRFTVLCLNTSRFHLPNEINIQGGSRPIVQRRYPSTDNGQKDAKRENIWTIPNFLTGTRIVLTPVLGNLILTEQFPWAAGLFLVAGFTDMIDGQIARAWPSQRSMLGTVIDPLADKFLISTATIALTVVNLLPLWLTSLIVARDVGLICASLWVKYLSLEPPITLAKFFNVKHATVEFKPTLISKINTVLQLVLVTAALGAPLFDFSGHPALVAACYVTGFTTVISGLSYIIWRRQTYAILKSKRRK